VSLRPGSRRADDTRARACRRNHLTRTFPP
jgi:hypothetical protein